MRSTILLTDETLDVCTKMLIGQALNLEENDDYRLVKLVAVIEFVEQSVQPSVGMCGIYLELLKLLPPTINRKMPVLIYEFIKKFVVEIEQEFGELPEGLRPTYIEKVESRLLGADGLPMQIKPSTLILQ